MPNKRKDINSGNCTSGCSDPPHCKGLCKSCYRKWHYSNKERARRGSTERCNKELMSRKIDSDGYVRIKIYNNKTDSSRGGSANWVKEHKYVMELSIGRRLFSSELVHHKNGIRHDNRIENLELWVVSHPKGHRVEDIVEYAEYILKTYKHLTAK